MTNKKNELAGIVTIELMAAVCLVECRGDIEKAQRLARELTVDPTQEELQQVDDIILEMPLEKAIQLVEEARKSQQERKIESGEWVDAHAELMAMTVMIDTKGDKQEALRVVRSMVNPEVLPKFEKAIQEMTLEKALLKIQEIEGWPKTPQ